MDIKKKINTIYIISKGRPHCKTARTLTRINYPGEWYIVCGDNDETIPEYIANWGEDRVLIFNWRKELEYTEVNDNFGFEKLGSGAVPVRNATARISAERGELRHWQFDDDYHEIRLNISYYKDKLVGDGAELEDLMLKIAEFGHKCGMSNVGFGMSTIEASPCYSGTYSKRVFNGHNMPSLGPLWQPWRSRMNDDLINAFDVWRRKPSGYEIYFRHLKIGMGTVGAAQGGNMDIYKNLLSGMVRKVSYAILIEPHNVKLSYVPAVGRLHHRVNWYNIVPKLISDKYDL